ncbi:MAG TPA: TatD family hydrolase [Geobacteraceae bacterium]|nr:TatD family hydrolase [Geobacteraceae bacterium]
MFIDTHCHLDDPSLSGRLPEVIGNARLARVNRFVVPGVAPAEWGKIATLASGGDGIYSAFGVHPMHAAAYGEEVLQELARHAGGAVAIGEIGLDYMLAEVPRELQMKAFQGQLQLAAEMELPVLIHCRKAFQDLLRIMREERADKVGGIMHAFSGSIETARECISLGFAISVAGPVTYQNAVRPLELVRNIPLEHLVLETDAPDMPPEPFRGTVNEPAYLVETAKTVAGIKGITMDELADITTANAERIFHFQDALKKMERGSNLI